MRRLLLILLFAVPAWALTPYMMLNKPTVNDTQYRQKFDVILNQVDEHDHTTGKGKQLPTGALVDSSVTSAKIAAGAVGTSDIADSAITTAKITDLNVTTGKLAAGVSPLLSITASPSFGYSNGTTAYTNAVSVTAAVSGVRPVLVQLQSGSSEGLVTANIGGSLQLKRNGSSIAIYGLRLNSGSVATSIPCSSISYIDSPGLTSVTYALEGKMDAASSSMAISACSLVVKEL